MRRFALLALTLLALMIVPLLDAGIAHGQVKALPATPASAKAVLDARRFTLQTPFTWHWSKERFEVSSGTLVVLAVDPSYAVPRESLEPVLYAGDMPVQRLNRGDKSGRVLGIIPGHVDLATTPIWFGTPELPGRVTRDMARMERAKADKAGVRAMAPAAKLAAADQPVITAPDLAALLRTVGADLLLEYSPQEKPLAEAWRLPVARAPAAK